MFYKRYLQIPKPSCFINESENIENGRNTYRIHNARNVINVGSKGGNKNFYDVLMGGSPSANDLCGCLYIGPGDNIYFCDYIGGGSNNYYSYFLENCSYCVGCIGLKNKQFCILNKEYSKEEWFRIVNKIFEQMEKDGVLGEFFPAWMNPFYFNDTLAYLIDDTFIKEEVEAEGYLRRDEKIKVDIPEGADVVEAKDLSFREGFENGERRINPEILKKVIRDGEGNYYKIVPMELEFLQKHSLPLPRLHWLERIKLGFKFK